MEKERVIRAREMMKSTKLESTLKNLCRGVSFMETLNKQKES